MQCCCLLKKDTSRAPWVTRSRILRAPAVSWLWSGAWGLVLPGLCPQLVLRGHEARKAVGLRVKGLVLPPVVWTANSVVTQTLQLCVLLCHWVLIHTQR